jgi:hypothetical protein
VESERVILSLRNGLASALLLILSACSPVNFSGESAAGTPGIANPGTGTPNTCTVETIYRNTKILFVVDTSGSNVDSTYNIINGQSILTPPTDPQKDFRGGAISDFLSDFGHKSNFQWGFMTFAGTSANASINAGSSQSPIFTADPNEMGDAVDSFYSKRDTGATPYGAALSLAAKAVSNDPDLNSSERPNYFVVLLTDGFPSDYYNDRGAFDQNVMTRDVANLVGIAPGRVTLSTIFYGQVNIPEAISLLKGMAGLGGGQFASVNVSNSNFKIDDVISKNHCD